MTQETKAKKPTHEQRIKELEEAVEVTRRDWTRLHQQCMEQRNETAKALDASGWTAVQKAVSQVEERADELASDVLGIRKTLDSQAHSIGNLIFGDKNTALAQMADRLDALTDRVTALEEAKKTSPLRMRADGYRATNGSQLYRIKLRRYHR